MNAVLLMLKVLALAIGIYELIDLFSIVSEGCCFKELKLREEKLPYPLIWSDELGAIASNPKRIWRLAVMKLAERIEEASGIKLIASEGMFRSIGTSQKILMIYRLIKSYDFKNGLRIYGLFRKALRSYPKSMEEAVNICKKINKLLKVMENAQ